MVIKDMACVLARQRFVSDNSHARLRKEHRRSRRLVIRHAEAHNAVYTAAFDGKITAKVNIDAYTCIAFHWQRGRNRLHRQLMRRARLCRGRLLGLGQHRWRNWRTRDHNNV